MRKTRAGPPAQPTNSLAASRPRNFPLRKSTASPSRARRALHAAAGARGGDPGGRRPRDRPRRFRRRRPVSDDTPRIRNTRPRSKSQGRKCRKNQVAAAGSEYRIQSGNLSGRRTPPALDDGSDNQNAEDRLVRIRRCSPSKRGSERAAQVIENQNAKRKQARIRTRSASKRESERAAQASENQNAQRKQARIRAIRGAPMTVRLRARCRFAF